MKRIIVLFGPQASGKTQLGRMIGELAGGNATVVDPWDPAFLTVEEIDEMRRPVVLCSQVVVSDLPEHFEVFHLKGRR